MISPVLELFQDVSVSAVAANVLRKGSYRLDASYYDPSSISAQQVIADSGHRVEHLSESAEVFCSTLRARTFVSSETGVALLGGHNLDTVDDCDVKFVSKLLTRNIDKERLQRGDVLISSAGTVGLFDFVWKNHEDQLASQHIIRIRARENRVCPGYLYAYLSSPLALAMVTNQSAGSVIVTLYTEHLEKFPLPRIGRTNEQHIHDMIIQSYEDRSRFRNLLKEAQSEVVNANSLDPLPSEAESESVLVRVHVSSATAEEYRLDAHFYNPTAQRAVANIRKCHEVKRVGDVIQRAFFCNRFTRTFVDREHGLPYLAGKNIIQIRPTELAHLSRKETSDLDQYRLQRGWILLTCSGTIGRTCLVWRNFEEYVGTHDLIRIVPEEEKVDGGYLYAFLSSEYGQHQILRYRHGSVIDHVTPEQVESVLVPLPSRKEQTAIGDKVREAYDKRAEAIRLEDEAQAILMNELTKAPGAKGV